MLTLLLRIRRIRRIVIKLALLLIVTTGAYFFLSLTLGHILHRSPNTPTSQLHIVFNLRGLNHSLPNFIAEIPAPEIDEPAHLPIFLPTQSLDYIELFNISSDHQLTRTPDSLTLTSSWSPVFGDLDTTESNEFFYENLIQEDEMKIVEGLGEGGEAVYNVPDVKASIVKSVMKKEAFNKILSDKISLTRTVPDARHSLCKRVVYDEHLPTASVIIIFINEAWSTLLRTVHSVLLRSPSQYLKEIILVDDASTRDELGGKLDYYIKTRLPAHTVKIIRLPKREGLIRARLAGAEQATGDVLVFLDSHCECVEGWLEPLLHRIKEKNNAVVTPIIDVINDKTLAYLFSTDRGYQVGSFTWSGHFTWIPIPDYEKMRLKSSIENTWSPTMAGGLFAMDREYFWNLGSYDSGMDVWGGENLEMSFRIWQCGGSLEVVPCSRVGHIFRKFHPYSFPGRRDTHGINTARMAEVWMDDYKRLFYMHRPDLKNASIGDISQRLELRKQLNCKDFKWYLQNILPDKFIPDENVKAYGRVKAEFRSFCFDNLGQGEDRAKGIGVYTCHNVLYSSQFYSLSMKGELRREERCAQVETTYIRIHGLAGGGRGNVTMETCDGSSRQIWKYEDRMIRHKATGFCIHIHGAERESFLTVADCRKFDLKFKWTWEYQLSRNGLTYDKHAMISTV